MVRVQNVLAVMALFSVSLVGRSQAQAPQGAPVAGNNPAAAARPAGPDATAGTRIGVIDIGYIFDNHPSYKQQQDAIDAEIAAAEQEINTRRESLLKELETLRVLNENSKDYAAKESEIANQESQLKLDFMRKEKEFAERKALIIYNTYQQIQALTQQWSTYNGIGMVMRYSRMDMDPKKPATVNAGVTRDVVFFSPNLDLTDPILNYIKQNTAAAPAQPSPQANPGVPGGVLGAGKPQPPKR